MGKGKAYPALTSVISLSPGTILPLIFGIRDPALIAIAFSAAWFFYAIAFFVKRFLITGRKNLKKRLKEGTNEKWGYS